MCGDGKGAKRFLPLFTAASVNRRTLTLYGLFVGVIVNRSLSSPPGFGASEGASKTRGSELTGQAPRATISVMTPTCPRLRTLGVLEIVGYPSERGEQGRLDYKI
jgi:hypothetical protein